VREYFLFDPHGDYLDPQLQGYRLRGGQYRAIRAVQGRLPSQELGLHLEPNGNNLRFYDPANQTWLLTPEQRAQQGEQAQAALLLAKQRIAQLEEEVGRPRKQRDDLLRPRNPGT